MENKKGQVTIFIIIAIVIVAGVVGFFVFRDKILLSGVSGEFSEVYTFFEDCVEQKTLQALVIAGSQGGYIETPKFEAGSEYSPFSSQLDFLGMGVPYWYYVSGNNVIKEQVPSVSLIENQVEDFLEVEIETCSFSDFRKQGYIINSGEPKVNVDIKGKKAVVEVNMDLDVERAESKMRKTKHSVDVESKFGKFYSLAKEIYEKEKSEMFLENYAVDVMYNYAPVTGVEVSCSPKVWNGQEVFDDLKAGLSANIGALRIGNKKSRTEDYFVVDVDSGENVNFIYSSEWPTRMEVWPAENSLLIAEPIGLEQGMGVMGFCYIPYHFVYDIYHPVLIQVYDADLMFQFPVSVVIDKSVPRNALVGESAGEETSLDELCDYKNTPMNVYTYDNNLNPIEADIDFVCLNARCDIGKTEIRGADAVLSGDFPQCVNGKIIAKAEGYVTEEIIVSTNEAGNVNILMDKFYELDFNLKAGGKEVSRGLAIVNFESEENSFTIVYPEQKKIKLSEGDYKVSAQIYSDASLTIPASSTRNCVEIPKGGFGSLFGQTDEQCFDVELPSQKIENALTAGGNLEEYILESDLIGAGKVEINAPTLPSVSSLEQLQQNYEIVKSNTLGVVIR